MTALASGFPEDHYTLFSASWKDRLRNAPENAAVGHSDWKLPVRALDFAWHRWRWPAVERLVGAIDVAHSPSPMLIPTKRAKRIVTVHDCYFMRHPEDVYGTVQRDYVPLARRSAQEADAIAVVSESTAAEAEELLGVSAAKIHVTRLGVGGEFFVAEASAASAMLDRYGVTGPFILFVGRREKRKDLGTLLAAFDELAAHTDDLTLALVGPDAPGWEDTWNAAPERVRQRTRLIPHQPPDTLPALFAAAEVVAMPSRWEGFGLPGLEAMAAGTPVVASAVGSLPEILGDAALFAAAGDATAMATQCARLLDDSELNARMRDVGRRHASTFSWAETARRTHALYEELAG